MLLADNKPVKSRNKPKLVLMWHSLSSRMLIYHFNTNISTERGGILGGSKSIALKIILLRQNNQNYIQSCSVIMELQKLSNLLFKHDHALYTKSGHSHSWARC